MTITDLSPSGLACTPEQGRADRGRCGRRGNGSRAPELDITGALTLEVVLKPSQARGHSTFISKGDTQWAFQIGGGNQLEFFLFDAGGSASWVTLTAPLPADWEGQWHRVAGVYDGQLLRHVRGRPRRRRQSRSRASARRNTFPVMIGNNAEHLERRVAGMIREARIYNRAITAAEVASPENRNDKGLVLWLDFTQAKERSPAGAARDFSGRSAATMDRPERPATRTSAATASCTPDRKPHPGLLEVKHIYQYVHCRPVDLSQRDDRDEELARLPQSERHCRRAMATDGRRPGTAEGRAADRSTLRRTRRSRVTLPIQPFTPEPGVEYFVGTQLPAQTRHVVGQAGPRIGMGPVQAARRGPRLPQPERSEDAPEVDADRSAIRRDGKGVCGVRLTRQRALLASLKYRRHGTRLLAAAA